MRRASPPREPSVGAEGAKVPPRNGLRTIPTMPTKRQAVTGYDFDHNIGSPLFPRDFDQLRSLIGSPLPPLHSPPLFQPSPRRNMLTSPARPANHRPNVHRNDAIDSLASFFPPSPALSRPFFSPTVAGANGMFDTPMNRALGIPLPGEIFTPTPRRAETFDHAATLMPDGGRPNGPQPGPPRPNSAPATGAAEPLDAPSGGSGSGGPAVAVNPAAAVSLTCKEQLEAVALRGQAQKASARGFMMANESNNFIYSQGHGVGVGLPGLDMRFPSGPVFPPLLGSMGSGSHVFGAAGDVDSANGPVGGGGGGGGGGYFGSLGGGDGGLQLNVKDMLLANEDEGGLLPSVPSYGLGGGLGLGMGMGLGRPRSRYLDFCATPRNVAAVGGGSGGPEGDDARGCGDGGGRPCDVRMGPGGRPADGCAGSNEGRGFLQGPGVGALPLPPPPLLPTLPSLPAMLGPDAGMEAPSPESLEAKQQKPFVSYPSSNEETRIAIAGNLRMQSGVSRTTAETPSVDPSRPVGAGVRASGTVTACAGLVPGGGGGSGSFPDMHLTLHAQAAGPGNPSSGNDMGMDVDMACGGAAGGHGGLMDRDLRVSSSTLPPPLPLRVLSSVELPRGNLVPEPGQCLSQSLPGGDDKNLVQHQIQQLKQQQLQQQQQFLQQQQLLQGGSGTFPSRFGVGPQPREGGSERPGVGLPPRSVIIAGAGAGGAISVAAAAASVAGGGASTPSTLQRPQRTRTANLLYNGTGVVNEGITSTRRVPSMDFDAAVPEPELSLDANAQPSQHRSSGAGSAAGQAGGPNRGRRTSESNAKSCRCKKSQCLKLYCDCFAAGQYCGACSCVACHNRPEHAERVLQRREDIAARDPQAFTRKIQMAPNGNGKHKRGCNCRKSHCLKKYCECYQGGVKCGIQCTCMECENMDLGGAVETTSGRGRRGAAAKAGSRGVGGGGSRAGSRRNSGSGMYDDYAPSPPLPSTSGCSEGPSPTPSQGNIPGAGFMSMHASLPLPTGPALTGHFTMGGGDGVTGPSHPCTTSLPYGVPPPIPTGGVLQFGDAVTRRNSANGLALPQPPQQQQQQLPQLHSSIAAPLPQHLLHQEHQRSQQLSHQSPQQELESSTMACEQQLLQLQLQRPEKQQEVGRQSAANQYGGNGIADTAAGGGGCGGAGDGGASCAVPPGLNARVADGGKAGEGAEDDDDEAVEDEEGVASAGFGPPKRQRRQAADRQAPAAAPPLEASNNNNDGSAPGGASAGMEDDSNPNRACGTDNLADGGGGAAAAAAAAQASAPAGSNAGGSYPTERSVDEANPPGQNVPADARPAAATAAAAMPPPPPPPGPAHHRPMDPESSRFTPRFTPRALGISIDVNSPPTLDMLAHLESDFDSEDDGLGGGGDHLGCRPRSRRQGSAGGFQQQLQQQQRGDGAGGPARADDEAAVGGLRQGPAGRRNSAHANHQRNGGGGGGMVGLDVGVMDFEGSSELADAMIAAIADEASRGRPKGANGGTDAPPSATAGNRSSNPPCAGADADACGASGGGIDGGGAGGLLCREWLGGSLLDDGGHEIFPFAFEPNSIEALREGLNPNPIFGMSHHLGPSPSAGSRTGGGGGATALSSLSPQRCVRPYGIGPPGGLAAAIGPPLGLSCPNSWLQSFRKSSRFAPTRSTCGGSGGGGSASGMVSFDLAQPPPLWPSSGTDDMMDPVSELDGPESDLSRRGAGWGMAARMGAAGSGGPAAASSAIPGVHTLVSPVRTSAVPAHMKRKPAGGTESEGGQPLQHGEEHRENGWVSGANPSGATSPSKQQRFMTGAGGGGGGSLTAPLQPLQPLAGCPSADPLYDPSYTNLAHNFQAPGNAGPGEVAAQHAQWMQLGGGGGGGGGGDGGGSSLQGRGGGRGAAGPGRGGRGGGAGGGGSRLQKGGNSADMEVLKASALQYMTQRLGGGPRPPPASHQQQQQLEVGSEPTGGAPAAAGGGAYGVGGGSGGMGMPMQRTGGDCVAAPSGLVPQNTHQSILQQPVAAFSAAASAAGAGASLAGAGAGPTSQALPSVSCQVPQLSTTAFGQGPCAQGNAGGRGPIAAGGGGGGGRAGGAGDSATAVRAGSGAAPQARSNHPATAAAISEAAAGRPESSPPGMQQPGGVAGSATAVAGSTGGVVGGAAGGGIFVTGSGAAGTPGSRQLVRMGGMTKLGSGSTVFFSPNSAKQRPRGG